MRYARIITGGLVVAAASGLLTACQVDKQFAASCSSSPPIPHHDNGVVSLSADVPHKVSAGSTFTVTVDSMGGDAGPEGGESMPHGTLGVTGGVTPSGNFAVGQGPFGGPAFPVELDFTANGQPGDVITISAVDGRGVIGQLPNASLVTCTPFGDATIVTIPIVAPPEDSVVGSGTAQFEQGGTSPIDVDVHSGPDGQDPNGTVALDTLFAAAPITCLEVRTMDPTGTPFDEATMNIQAAELGLVTLQLSDGDPEGLPDSLSAITSSSRSPDDCSRIVFGTQDLRAILQTGNLDFHNQA